MQASQKLLKDYSNMEKGAYLAAIASIATADRVASDEEIEYLEELAESAELSSDQKEIIKNAATELTGEDLKKCLDILKKSDLRYSLVTDLITFAHSDQNYTDDEKANIEKIATYLEINNDQFSVLNEFVDETTETKVEPENMEKQGFFGSSGIEDKLKSAGINIGSLTKGLLGIAGPMILASLVNKGIRRTTGGLGSALGGGRAGGFGSLISMLNGRRGIGSTGGLFSRILRGL